MRISWPDIPGQTLRPFNRPAILVRRPAGPPPDAHPLTLEIDTRWASLCANNPRLRDGTILTVRDLDLDGPQDPATFTVAPASFRHLAVQTDEFELGIRLLGVKGLIVGHDEAGREHVWIARRSPQTRIYHHMWEIAPAGGVDLLAEGTSPDAAAVFRRVVVDEAREELGIDLSPEAAGAAHPVAIVHDEIARSIDVIVRVDWPGTINPRAGLCTATGCNWEYSDAAWLARADAGEFDRKHHAAIVPVMRAVLRWMGWTANNTAD